MDLQDAKYVSMLVLFGSTLLTTLMAMGLQRFVLHRGGNALSVTQRVISCLTSGIFLGTLLILILPNSLDLAAQQWHGSNTGYFLVGLGFFLICAVKELISLYESYSLGEPAKTENEQLINPSDGSQNDHQYTRLVTLVFALGVHYFFTGILVGGQTKDTTALWLVLGAICFHMSLVAFSVTLRLLIDNENYLRVFLAMITWTLMGPVGVLLSLSISTDSSGLTMINGILQGISAGTFVYITFIDMLHDDLSKKIFYPFVNVLLIFSGFLIIALAGSGHQHAH